MNKKLRNIISLVFNIAVVAILIRVLVDYIAVQHTVSPRGMSYFAFYTTDSNLMYAIICLITIPFNIMFIVNKNYKIPKWVSLIRFYGTTVVAVTFFVVLFLLGPLNPGGFIELYEGMPFYLHLIVPLIAMINFILFDQYNDISFIQLFINTIPTLIYGIFYALWVNVFKQIDAYTFFKHGIPISILIYIGIFLLCFGLGALFRYLYKLRNRQNKNR